MWFMENKLDFNTISKYAKISPKNVWELLRLEFVQIIFVLKSDV